MSSQVCETMDELLIRACPSRGDTGSLLTYHRARPHAQTTYLTVSRDCGYHVDERTYEVSPQLAQRAVDAGFFRGRPDWGYTSSVEWIVTERGRVEALAADRRRHDRVATAKLGERVVVDRDPGDEG